MFDGTEQWIEVVVRSTQSLASDPWLLPEVPPDIDFFVSEMCDLLIGSKQTMSQLGGKVLDDPAGDEVVSWAYQSHVPLVLLPVDDVSRDDAPTIDLQQRITGMAVIVRCKPEVASDLLASFSMKSPTPSGSMLSIVFSQGYPVLDVISSFSAAHQRDAAIRRIHRNCVNAASHIELPPSVAAVIGAYESLDSGNQDEALWAATALDLDQENLELRAMLNDLRYQYDLMIMDQEDVEVDLDQAHRDLRYLRKRLNELGDFGYVGEPIEQEFIPVVRCEQAVARAREMDFLWVGEVASTVRQLDLADKSTLWAKKALRAFTALNDYAESKAKGTFNGNFLTFCSDPVLGPGLPDTWVALTESESTGQRPLTRGFRTFDVPPTVATVGAVYMEAHLKLSSGDGLAPRVHFFDDTGGQSGKILVGYFGPHLETGG